MEEKNSNCIFHPTAAKAAAVRLNWLSRKLDSIETTAVQSTASSLQRKSLQYDHCDTDTM